MSLAGPRLDRPSAVGDEGRARAASLWIATLVVVALVVAAGVAVGEPSLVTVVATVAGLTVAGIALLDRPGFADAVVGNALLVTVGSAFALLVFASPFVGRVGAAVVGCTVALFGVAMAWADVGGDGLKRSAVGVALTYGSMLVAAVLATVLVGFAMLVWGILELVVAASTPLGSLAGVHVVAVGLGCALLFSEQLLPVRQLAPRSRRDRVEGQLAAVRRSLVRVTVGSLASLLAVCVLWATGALGPALRAVPPLEAALVATSSPVVVWPLVGVGVAAGLAGITAATARQVTGAAHGGDARHNAAVAVGVALVGFGVVVALVLFAGSASPVQVAVLVDAALVAAVVLVVGPLAFLVLVGVLVAGAALGVVPDRAGGPAVAAGGLVLGAIGLGWSHPVLVFAYVAGAALLWDVSTFGLGLTAELGHRPDTRRLELLHGVVSVGVAVGAVVLVTGLETVRTGLFGGVGASTALVAACAGAVVLLLPLRG